MIPLKSSARFPHSSFIMARFATPTNSPANQTVAWHYQSSDVSVWWMFKMSSRICFSRETRIEGMSLPERSALVIYD